MKDCLILWLLFSAICLVGGAIGLLLLVLAPFVIFLGLPVLLLLGAIDGLIFKRVVRRALREQSSGSLPKGSVRGTDVGRLGQSSERLT